MREYHVPFCENFGLKYSDLLVECVTNKQMNLQISALRFIVQCYAKDGRPIESDCR